VPGIVRSVAHYKLDELNDQLKKMKTNDQLQRAQIWYLDSVLELLEENPEAIKLTPPVKVPMGAPI
jgi:hypothetical protein